MKKVATLLGASLMVISFSGPVRADSPGEVEELRQQVQELLKRIDNLEKKAENGEKGSGAPHVTSSKKNVSVKISGRVNRKILAVHDGDRSRVKHVDGASSSSRLGVKSTAKLNDDVKVGARWEVEFGENKSSSVAAGREFDGASISSIKNRHVYTYVESQKYGTLTLGHTGEANYGVMEDTDLSGTDVVVSGSSHEDVAGNYRFFNTATNRRATGNGGNGIRVKDVIDGFDGDRKSVVRYDTPIWRGLQASASHNGSNSDTTAFALRYEGKLYGTKIATAAAYANVRDHDTDTPQVGTENSAFRQYNASIGLLHPTGFNFYIGGGRRDFSNDKIARGSMWNTKVGYTTGFFDFGKTSFSIDYGEFNDLFPTRIATNDKFKAKAYGLGVVQSFERIATDFYFGVKRYLLDANQIEDNGNEVEANYKGITAVFAGARVKF